MKKPQESSPLAATDRAVTDGKAKSRNESIDRAIQRELALIRRAEIDTDERISIFNNSKIAKIY